MDKALIYRIVLIVTILGVCLADAGFAQNCCAPAVPQQGVLGETVALPHTLEVGLHYEIMRSKKLYECSCTIDNATNKKADWERATLTMSYGIFSRLGIGVTLPYAWKENSWYISGRKIIKSSDGIGDIVALLRLSLIPRSFVNYRELSLGFGMKFPTGATDRLDSDSLLLAEELQPGTGSWDYHMALSYYQGFESVDFTVSGNYVITTEYDEYEFGNQFYYLLSSNFHLYPRLDLSAALSGVVRGKDIDYEKIVENTGRHQLWFSSGVQYQMIEELVRVQTFFELPVYQRFDGTQLGGGFNLRFSASMLIPLKESD